MTLRNLEKRLRYLERLARMANRRSVNESTLSLPNGKLAYRVSDVLSYFANDPRMNVDTVVRRLIDDGTLGRATNKWYPTVDDVAEAVYDCWDDSLGMFNGGAAQFFMSNYGDCALTLYPVVGGDSRARKVILKFKADV